MVSVIEDKQKEAMLDELKISLDKNFTTRFVETVRYNGISDAMVQLANHLCYNTSCFTIMQYEVTRKEEDHIITIEVIIDNKPFWQFSIK